MARDHRSAPDRASAAVAVRPLTALRFVRVPQTVGLRARAHRRRLSVVELVAERQPRRTRARVRPDLAAARAGLALDRRDGRDAASRGRSQADAGRPARSARQVAAEPALRRSAEQSAAQRARRRVHENRRLSSGRRRPWQPAARKRLFSRRRRLPWAIAGGLVVVLAGGRARRLPLRAQPHRQRLSPARPVHRGIDAHGAARNARPTASPGRTTATPRTTHGSSRRPKACARRSASSGSATPTNCSSSRR